MKISPGNPAFVTSYQGRSFYFCTEECLQAFENDPKKYLDLRLMKQKGLISRFLDRLAEANKKQFGSKGPRCCH
jgi:YHS domain-containing protein